MFFIYLSMKVMMSSSTASPDSVILAFPKTFSNRLIRRPIRNKTAPHVQKLPYLFFNVKRLLFFYVRLMKNPFPSKTEHSLLDKTQKVTDFREWIEGLSSQVAR